MSEHPTTPMSQIPTYGLGRWVRRGPTAGTSGRRPLRRSTWSAVVVVGRRGRRGRHRERAPGPGPRGAPPRPRDLRGRPDPAGRAGAPRLAAPAAGGWQQYQSQRGRPAGLPGCGGLPLPRPLEGGAATSVSSSRASSGTRPSSSWWWWPTPTATTSSSGSTGSPTWAAACWWGGPSPPSAGARQAFRLFLWGAVVVAVISVGQAVRHPLPARPVGCVPEELHRSRHVGGDRRGPTQPAVDRHRPTPRPGWPSTLCFCRSAGVPVPPGGGVPHPGPGRGDAPQPRRPPPFEADAARMPPPGRRPLLQLLAGRPEQPQVQLGLPPGRPDQRSHARLAPEPRSWARGCASTTFPSSST